ncbi:phosphotransferase [Enterococcus sp.]|uniref:aminoglycoside phosphotransferase family protein n=1 Tax=Enterococcus sp. TaxID=35783 RepID=UPI00289B584B|nr:phosphotransferase [Enterococcus sp.]
MNKKKMGRNDIKIEGTKVIRPKKEWSANVHFFLEYLRNNHVEYVPIPLGFDQFGNELLSYLPGEVYDYPLPTKLLTDKSIISAGKLLKDFHDKGAGFLEYLSGDEKWMLSYDMPHEVMCHSDFAPYNTTTENGIAIGIIDFDTLVPGSRLWDVVYGAYRWVPLYFDDVIDITESMHIRLRLFLEAYGFPQIEYSQIVPYLIKRLKYLIEFMEIEAQKGEKNFHDDILKGHINKYKNDIEKLKYNEKKILNELNRKQGNEFSK